MPRRSAVTAERLADVIVALMSTNPGRLPTRASVRQALGDTGSFETIARLWPQALDIAGRRDGVGEAQREVIAGAGREDRDAGAGDRARPEAVIAAFGALGKLEEELAQAAAAAREQGEVARQARDDADYYQTEAGRLLNEVRAVTAAREAAIEAAGALRAERDSALAELEGARAMAKALQERVEALAGADIRARALEEERDHLRREVARLQDALVAGRGSEASAEGDQAVEEGAAGGEGRPVVTGSAGAALKDLGLSAPAEALAGLGVAVRYVIGPPDAPERVRFGATEVLRMAAAHPQLDAAAALARRGKVVQFRGGVGCFLALASIEARGVAAAERFFGALSGVGLFPNDPGAMIAAHFRSGGLRRKRSPTEILAALINAWNAHIAGVECADGKKLEWKGSQPFPRIEGWKPSAELEAVAASLATPPAARDLFGGTKAR
jgi:hypothetical protein